MGKRNIIEKGVTWRG